MTQTKRLFLNVLATNGRSLYTMACGLLTGRWMLLSLGEQDYGLLGLVGGLIAFMTIFNGIFSSAVSRYYAFSIGAAKSDVSGAGLEECRRWFNLAVAIHVVLPCLIFSLGYPIGEWTIRHWLNIPSVPGRVEDCVWVFRFSCLSCMIGIMGVPFRAMYVAKQEIAELTIYTFLTATANVVVLYYMVTHKNDWLVMMAAWMATMVIVPVLIIAIRALFVYPECRFVPRYMKDLGRTRQLFGFAGWQFLGNLGSMLRDQGNAILVNKFLGPAFNASNTIANTVSGHAQMFANEMNGAFAPAITTACGANDFPLMNKLVQRCSKYSGLAVLFLSIPLILEMQGVMEFWLKTPPPGVATIAVCTCLACVVNKATSGQWMAMSAMGRVALINVAEFSSYMLMIVLSAIALVCDGSIVWVGYSMLTAMCFLAISRVLIARFSGKMPITGWVNGVGRPLLVVGTVAFSMGYSLRFFMEPSLLRLLLTGGVATGAFIMMAWGAGLSSEEREYVVGKIRGKFLR